MRDVFPPTDRGIFSCEGNVLFHWTRFDPVHAPKQLLPLQLLPLQRQTEVVRVLRRPESSTDSRSGRLSRRPDGTFVLRTWCRTLVIGATPQAPRKRRGGFQTRLYPRTNVRGWSRSQPANEISESTTAQISLFGNQDVRDVAPAPGLAGASHRTRTRPVPLALPDHLPGPRPGSWVGPASAASDPARDEDRRQGPSHRRPRIAALASPLLHRRFCAAGAVDMRADVREGRGPRGAQTSK